MRVVFMGTPDFAAGTLDEIIKKGHDVIAVVTQPDKPKGRGKELAMSAVKIRALQDNLLIYQPKKVRETEFVDILKALNPDVIVVVAFGQLLPKAILDIPKYGCINVHASLLPKYRGAAPIQWAVIDGEEETGVTIMNMDEGLDTGDMLKVVKTKLTEDETGGSLFDRLAEIGANALVDTLEELEKGEITPVKQEGESSYAGKLDKTLGKIDFTKSAVELERLIRGLNPWPSAYTEFKGKTLKIWRAQVEELTEEVLPGMVYEVNNKYFSIATGCGGLRILELQLEGKKRMDTESFLRGTAVEKGICL